MSELGEGLSAREKLLVEGQHDWVKLWEAHRHVAEENLSATLSEVQAKTLELLRSLVVDGVAEIGELRDHGARFDPWHADPDILIKRVSGQYVDHFHDAAGWPWSLWLRITDAGKSVGQAHEAAYQQWLHSLREQGLEDQALPLRFDPSGADTGS